MGLKDELNPNAKINRHTLTYTRGGYRGKLLQVLRPAFSHSSRCFREVMTAA